MQKTVHGDSSPAEHPEQEDCDKRFKILDKIGEGTYGVVYKAVDLSTNQVSQP